MVKYIYTQIYISGRNVHHLNDLCTMKFGTSENNCKNETKNKAFEWHGCITTWSLLYTIIQTHINIHNHVRFLTRVIILWRKKLEHLPYICLWSKRSQFPDNQPSVKAACSQIITDLHFHVPSWKIDRVYFCNLENYR